MGFLFPVLSSDPVRRARDGRVNGEAVNGPGPPSLPSPPQTVDWKWNSTSCNIQQTKMAATVPISLMGCFEGTKLTMVSLFPSTPRTVHGEMTNHQDIGHQLKAAGPLISQGSKLIWEECHIIPGALCTIPNSVPGEGYHSCHHIFKWWQGVYAERL